MVCGVFGVFSCIVGGIFGSLDLDIFLLVVFGENLVCVFFMLVIFLVNFLWLLVIF